MALVPIMSYTGINYDYSYRDSALNNHDRTSWLRDNFLRPRYDTPLSQNNPAFFNTTTAAAAASPDVISSAASDLFPRHEFTSGRTTFGSIAPSKLPARTREGAAVPWAAMARGLPSQPTRQPMAVPPSDAREFVADVEGSIRRQVACLHGRNVHSFSSRT
jgi:hypothetical protein